MENTETYRMNCHILGTAGALCGEPNPEAQMSKVDAWQMAPHLLCAECCVELRKEKVPSDALYWWQEEDHGQTFGTDQPTCPYCGEEQGDAWELRFNANDQTTTECGHCGESYIVEREISVSYTTGKVKQAESDRPGQ